MADALHFHQLIYRRIVRSVFHDDESRRMLMRNNRTSPYLGLYLADRGACGALLEPHAGADGVLRAVCGELCGGISGHCAFQGADLAAALKIKPGVFGLWRLSSKRYKLFI